MARSRMQEARPQEPDTAAASETGRTALGVSEGGPQWLNLPLYAVLGVGILFILVSLAFGWGHWTLLVGMVLAVAGLVLALNPRRDSPAGGTTDRP
jgi:hypothetical protein